MRNNRYSYEIDEWGDMVVFKDGNEVFRVAKCGTLSYPEAYILFINMITKYENRGIR